MNEIASSGQLRMSFVRWALVTVPAIVGLGSLMGLLSNSGENNGWFAALDKSSLVPPGWVIGAVWTLLYVLMGLAIAIILNARGARGRGLAITLFLAQLVVNFAWSFVFFAQHKLGVALAMTGVMFVLAAAATWLFRRIRPTAGLLMLPYLAWLCFAGFLNWDLLKRNPDAQTLVPPAVSTNISLGQGN